MTAIDMQNEDAFKDGILEIVNAISDIHDRAMSEYLPLVEDICSRKATEDDVDHLLHGCLISWKMNACFYFSKRYAMPIFTHIQKL